MQLENTVKQLKILCEQEGNKYYEKNETSIPQLKSELHEKDIEISSLQAKIKFQQLSVCKFF